MQEQEQLLRKQLDKIALEKGFVNYKLNLRPITSDGANYTSAIFYGKLTDDDTREINFFAKVASFNEHMRSYNPYQVFETENFFYTDLIKTYRRIEEKHNVPEEEKLVTPEFFGVSMEYLKEVFVMEDLKSKGYGVFDRFKSIDWNYAQESMKQLAKLHALSMAYSIEGPEEFEEKTKNLTMNLRVVNEYMPKMLENVLTCTKEEYKNRLERFIAELVKTNRIEYMVRPIKRTVLAHGDFRPSNIMHIKNEDGTYSLIVVDYQSINRCNPIVDIIFFIFLSTEQDFRAKYYQKMLDLYYSELCASLTKFKLDPKIVYPREDFEYELREVLPYGIIISMMFLLLITVDVEDAIVFESNSNIEDISYTPNERYKKRLNEIFEDFIAMGIL